MERKHYRGTRELEDGRKGGGPRREVGGNEN